jgi:hypothetical protein
VLPLESRHGVRIDIIFGMLPFEQDAIRRARPIRIGDLEVRVCSPEDLIVMKIASERPRDLEDVRGVLRRRLADLDLDYLEPRIHELSSLLDRPELVQQWEAWKGEAARKD